MAKAKAKAGLRGLKASEKKRHATAILESMRGNPLFTAPSPSMVEFGEAIDRFEQAMIEALDLGRRAVIRKNLAEQVITDMISRLAGYVNSVCMGDEVKILSSGFELAKRPSPISAISAPKAATARPGSGTDQLILRWRTVPGAVVYLVEEAVGKDPQTAEWSFLDVTSDHRMELEGRNKVKTTTFRVQAIGRRTKGPFTEFIYDIAA